MNNQEKIELIDKIKEMISDTWYIENSHLMMNFNTNNKNKLAWNRRTLDKQQHFKHKIMARLEEMKKDIK